LDDLAECTRHAHLRIVGHYRKQCDGDWPQLANDEYARYHLAAHLVGAGMNDVLCALVTEGAAHNAWAEVRYSRENTYAGYLADLNLAWHWAESDRWWDVGRQIRCALIQSSVYSLVENVSPDLIYRLVETGRWKPQEGLVHVLQIPDERQRGAALKKVFPLLPMSLKAKALVAARTTTDSATRAMTLGSLSCELAQESRVSVMREALRVAQGITHDAVRAQVLGELSKNVPAELHADAVEMARGFAGKGTRALALISLLEHLPGDQGSGIAREALTALRGVEDESILAVALKDLGPHLSTSLRAEALVIAREIEDDEARARALTGLVKTLAGSQKTKLAREAWRTTQHLTDESARAFVIADLAGYLPDDLKAEALEAVQGISDDFVRLFALSELVKHLPGDLATRVIRQALRTVRGMENDIARAMSLLLVGESLPDRFKPEALAVARETADERARAFALSQLVEHLPDDLKSEALIAARKMSNLWARATALSAMVDHVPQAARAGVVADALNAARSISDEWARAIALKGLAEYLPEEFKLQVPQDEIGEQGDGFLAEAIRDTLAATLKGLDAQSQDADEWMAEARSSLAGGQMQEALASAVHAEPVVGNRRAELLAEIASAWKATGFAELEGGRDVWRKTLHALARHRRPEFLNDLAALAPLIVQVGGTAALAETFRAIRDVARWWS
jgi:hypothetical protein